MATERQKKAIDNMLENGGIVSRAMRDAGYTDATSKTPQKLTESKAYKELVEEAKRTIAEIMRSGKKDDVRLKAAQDIVDRSEGKATQRSEITGDMIINIVQYADDDTI
jgi:hypothetical protein